MYGIKIVIESAKAGDPSSLKLWLKEGITLTTYGRVSSHTEIRIIQHMSRHSLCTELRSQHVLKDILSDNR